VGHVRDASQRIGTLQEAIAGTDLSGFIGEVYRLFPFLKEAAAFKQNHQGSLARGLVTLVLTVRYLHGLDSCTGVF